jgi:hypothetical protein
MRSGVFLELRALLDEALSGRMRNFEGSFARLLGMIGPNIAGFVALNPILSGFAAAAAVAAGGAAYLAYQMHLVAEERAAIAQGGAFSGNFQIIDPKAVEQARQAVDTLRGVFTGLGEKDVAEVINSIQQMGNFTNQVMNAMAADMANMWQQFGKDEKEAAKNMVSVFSDPMQSIDKIDKAFNGLTEDQRLFVTQAQASGNVLEAQAAIQTVAAQRSRQAHAERVAQLDALITKEKEWQTTVYEADANAQRMAQDNIDEYQKEKDAITKIDDALAGWAPKIADAAKTAQMLGDEFRKLVVEANKVSDAVDKIGAETRKQGSQEGILTAGIQAAIQRDDVGEINRLTAALKALHQESIVTGQKASDPYERTAIVKAEQDIKEWEASTKASQDQVRAHSAQVWLAMSKDTSLSVEQQHEAHEKYIDSVIAGNNAAAKSGLKAAKETERALLDSLNTQIGKIQEIARTDIELAQMRVKAHTLTAKAGEAAEQAAMKTELDAINKVYAQELAIAGLTVDQIAAIKKKMELEDLKIRDQMTINAQKAADATAQAWQSSMKEVNSAIDSQINPLLTGTEKLRTAFANVAKSLIEGQIKSGLNSLLTGVESAAGKAAGIPGAAASVQGGGLLGTLITTLTTAMGLNTAATTVHTAVAATNATGVVANTVATATNTAATTAASTTGGGGFLSALAGLGTLFGFADGTPMVQQSGLAVIHQGEAIIPAQANPFNGGRLGMISGLGALANPSAPSFDAGAGGGSQAGTSAPSGGDTHVHFNVSAVDGAGVGKFFKDNHSHIANAVGTAIRQGSGLGNRNLAFAK